MSDSAPARILIVDDEFHPRQVLRAAATALGHEVVDTASPEEALKLARFEKFDVLVTDMKMPLMDGLKLLQSVRIHAPLMSVILCTAHGSIETAVEAMKNGAEDYLLKPIELPAFEIALERILKKRALFKAYQALTSENEVLKRDLQIRYHLKTLLGRSPASKNLKEAVTRALSHRDPVLIEGETGTGKNDLGRMIHYNSPWAARSILFFDVAAVPEIYHEIQLFGEELRVGTQGSALTHPGVIERAHLGTLILSNVGELSQIAQQRLLACMETGKVQRMGGSTGFHLAIVRYIITATPLELQRDFEGHRMIEPLADLLKKNRIVVEPLRNRQQDIPILFLGMIRELEGSYGKKFADIDSQILVEISSLPFLGNMRELKDLAARVIHQAQGDKITLADYQQALRST